MRLSPELPLNHNAVVREARWSTEPQLFDALPFVSERADDQGVPVLKHSLEALALVYVHRRLMSGQINRRTAEQLRSRLRSFCDLAPSDPRRVNRRHVEKWMERPDLRPLYRRSRLSALRGFTRWCVSEGHMTKDPCALVPMPKAPPGMPKRLTQDEAERLVAAVRHDRRTLLVVLLMLQEGLRRIEVSRLDVEDIDFAEHSMVIHGKGGHGCPTDALPITDETWRVLTAYLAEEGHQSGPLIRNRVRKHGRTAPTTVSELVRQGMVDAGVKKPGNDLRTPHSCRHTCAHGVLAATGDIRKTQKVMRHKSIRTTEGTYLNGWVDDLRDAMSGRTYGASA